MKQTSAQWWNQTKGDPSKLIAWLKDQYHGEKTAAKRIKELFFTAGNTLTNKEASLLERIISEEERHAHWVKTLLTVRGIKPEILVKEERYWNKVLPKTEASKEQLAAIAHLAETMRLERIGVIAADTQCPKDIRNVFKRILPMELNHAKWFAELSTNEHIKSALVNHHDGMNELGLVI